MVKTEVKDSLIILYKTGNVVVDQTNWKADYQSSRKNV